MDEETPKRDDQGVYIIGYTFIPIGYDPTKHTPT